MDAEAGGRIGLVTWPGLAALAAVMATGAWFGQPAVTLLAALVAAAGAVARGWTAVSLAALHADCRLSASRIFPGEPVTLELTADNRKPLPLAWVRIAARLPDALRPVEEDHEMPGGAGFETPLGWYRTAALSCPLDARRRGWYPIGPLEISSGDVFGLFTRRRRLGGTTPLVVYPRLLDMAELGLPPRFPLGEARDPLQLFEDPSRLKGLREYTPETPFKTIAWSATARTGTLTAKTFEATATLRMAIVLAVDGFPPAEDDKDEIFEYAVSAVASMANRCIDQRHSVAVYANARLADGAGELAVDAARGEDQRLELLEGLAKVRHEAAQPFDAFHAAHAGAFSGATVCIVTARTSDAVRACLEASSRGGRRAILLVAGDGPLPRGPFHVHRLETKRTLAA